MSDERRAQVRYAMPIECTWNGASGFAETRISDLSLTGCYVDSRQVPVTGESVEIRVTVAGELLALIGEVVHANVGMGFAARFGALDDSTRRRLADFLSTVH